MATMGPVKVSILRSQLSHDRAAEQERVADSGQFTRKREDLQQIAHSYSLFQVRCLHSLQGGASMSGMV